MPVQKCTKGGKPGWRWGKSGKCYIGSGAKAKAAKQGAAIKASGNQEHDVNMRRSGMLFQKITTNFVGTVRNDTMEGRDYLVAPMIMIVEGVHEGSNGPLYYPADELAKIPSIWNHKPIVVYHPQLNGAMVSACDPDILSNRKVGVIMNTTFDDGKLKAEAWLEIDRMNKVDERIAEAIENKETMELSTGLFTDNENVEGEWNGEAYEAIARNYRPDHLALLPDLKGACSIEDGAGFLRLNAEQNSITIDLKTLKYKKAVECLKNKGDGLIHCIQKFVENEISFDDTRQRLQSILKGKFGEDDYVWIEDVFDEYVVYDRAGILYRQDYDDVDGAISFKGMAFVVKKDIKYIPVTNVVKNERKVKMNKKEKAVKALIENKGTHWEEDDKEDLMEFDEEILNKMIPVENQETNTDADDNKDKDKDKDKKTTENEDKTKEDKDKDKASDGEEEEATANMSAEDYINTKVPDGLKGVLRSGLASYNAGKTKLIEVITTNKKNTFTKEQLEAKDLDELKSLATLAADTEKQQEAVVTALNYGGQSDPVTNTTEETPMDEPVWNFEEEKRKRA